MAYIGAGISRFNTADELTVTGDAQIDGTTLVVDSTNNRVGIGTSSPEGLIGLPATASNTPKFRLQSASTNTDFAISSYADANGTYVSLGANYYLNSSGNDAVFETTDKSAYVVLDARNNGMVSFGTNSSGVATERMRITSAGLVGIGTASPAHLVDALVSSGSASARFGTTHNSGDNDGTVIISNGGSGDAMLRFDYEGSNTDRARIGVTSSGQQLQFYTAGNNERMRIDNNGNVLVGTTNTDPAFNNIAGQSMAASGQFQVTRDGGTAALFNRKSSNGEIVSLRKDGTTVGSISTSTGVTTDLILDPRSSFGSGISGAGLAILPMDHSQRADNHTDLGEASNRWKDLYLSGGAYIGGTGSSNYLNDYEEGTWTPAVANGTVTVGNNRYTKIGNIVNLRCQLSSFSDRSSSAAITISGLPFGSGSASSTAGVVLGRYNDAGDGPIVANIGNSASIMNLYGMSDGGNWAGINHSNLNNAAATFLINITYSVS